jgi:RHS repeat-associated protein
VTLSIISPDGTTLASRGPCSSPFFYGPVTLPETGAYVLLVSPQNGNTGSATFSLALFSNQTGTTIAPGAPAGVTISVPGQSAQLTFTGNAGQLASIQMTGSTLGCVVLSIISPDGTTLASPGPCSSPYFYGPVTLPGTGTYTLLVSPQNGNTGSATFSLALFSNQTGTTIAPGTPAGVTITTPGQSALLTFSGTAGQQASIQMTGSTLGCVVLSIISPDGTALANQGPCSSPYFYGPLTLPATGTYTLLVSPQNGGTGSATFSLALFSNQTGATIAPGTPVGVTITTPGQSAQLTFTGNAGQLASIQMTGSTLGCVVLSIISPDGTTLASPGPCSSPYFYGPVTLPATGTYTLLVSPQNGNTGSATFSLALFSNQTGTTIAPGSPAGVTTTAPGQSALVTFSGVAGQQASIQMSGSTLGCVVLNIISPDGTTLTSQGPCGSSYSLGPVTLPGTGTYTLLVSPQNGTTGSATFSLALSGNQGTTINAGTPAGITTSTPGQTSQMSFSGSLGQIASVQVSNFSYNVDCSSVAVELVNPNGSTLATGNACGSAFPNPVPLPATANYGLEIVPPSTGDGSATVTLTLAANPNGPLVPGTSVPLNLNSSGPVTLFAFDGSAGQSITVAVSNLVFPGGCGGVNITIFNPYGTTLANDNACGESIFSNPVALPATGTYALVVSEESAGTGTANLTLWQFDPLMGSALTSGSPMSVVINNPGQQDQLTFSGAAGQFMNLQFSNESFPDGCGSSTVQILNPDGTQLVASYPCGQLLRQPVSLPATGIYTVVIGSANGYAETGSLTTTLWLFSEQSSGILASGTPSSVAITTPGQQDQVTFSGTAGQFMNLLFSNLSFPDGCGGAWVTVLNPDGTQLAATNPCGQLLRQAVALPGTGTYTVVVGSANGYSEIGSLTTTLWLFSEQTSGTMTSGVPSSVAIGTPGQQNQLTFSGTAGEYMNLLFSNLSFPDGCGAAWVSVLNPDGTQLAATNPCSQLLQQPTKLPGTGTYTVVVGSANGYSETGSLTVMLSLFGQTIPIAAGTPTAVSIQLPGQQTQLTFSGTAGQYMNLLFSNMSFPDSCGAAWVSVLNPDGTQLAANSPCSQLLQQPIKLPGTGTYTIVIGSANGYSETGSLTVTLWLFAEQSSGAISSGTPASVTISTPGQQNQVSFSGTAGQYMNLLFTNVHFPDGCGAAWVSVLNPDGTQLVATNPCSQLLRQPIELPATGTYTVVIGSANGYSETGSLTVTLWLFSEQSGGTIASGTQASIAITTPGQQDQLTFNAAAGQYMNLLFSNVSFTDGCGAAWVSVLNPDGTQLTANTPCNQLVQNPIPLPATGTYSIVIGSANGYSETGFLTATLSLFGQQTPGPNLSVGVPTPVTLFYNSQTQQSLTFSGVAGQYMNVLFSDFQSTGSTCSAVSVAILKSDGANVAPATTLCNSQALAQPALLPSTGIYSVVFQFSSQIAQPSALTATLWMFSEETGTVAPGTPTSVAINIPGQQDQLSFSGTAGSYVDLSFSSVSFGNGCNSVAYSILDPTGATVTSGNGCDQILLQDPLQLSINGTYTLVIGSPNWSSFTGTMTALLLEGAPAPPPTFSPIGGLYPAAQSVSIVDAAPDNTIYYSTSGGPVQTYTGPIVIPIGSTTTLTAIATVPNTVHSLLASATYIIAPPAITGLSPDSAEVGTSVTITGTDFGATAGTVTFNGTAAQVSNWSDTSITVTVPTGATTGNVVVTVGGVASNGVPFTVAAVPLYSFSIQTTGGGAEGYDPVGNVTGYTDSVNGTWSFTYDSLNRVATATGSQTNNSYPNYCWQYDNFGNRLWQTSSATPYALTAGGANACPVTIGPSSWAQYNGTVNGSNNNQMSGTSQNVNQGQNYDASGNITYDGMNSYLYDAEGRICAVQQSYSGITTMTQYLYDAEGHRVAKGNITNWTAGCDTTQNGFAATTVYVLGPGGDQMTEMTNNSGTWQWEHTNVFAPGLSATYDVDPTGQTDGQIYFHLSDWLGTRRQQTDYAGNPCLEFISQTYGDGLTSVPVSNCGDATENHFTGKERDPETGETNGNDYFGARYYASSMGRFLSPDWSAKEEPVPYAKLENPQTLNLYAYVGNDPLSNIDTDGHACSGWLGNTNSGFCTRAAEYNRADANPAISSQTAFFAAASEVSTALGNVAVLGSGLYLDAGARNFLDDIGNTLLTLNRRTIAQIGSGALSGPGLDEALVHIEQSKVQEKLDSLYNVSPYSYANAIDQINLALNSGFARAFTYFSDQDYADVLKEVHDGLRRDIDFSNQSDREAIGNTVIKHVRRRRALLTPGGCPAEFPHC